MLSHSSCVHAFKNVFEDTGIKIEMSAASNEIFNVKTGGLQTREFLRMF
ncbi:MAG: hypothetical protein Ct9H300mP28_19280 [Pseudomonadota bacterium]|nr:MAG: hypothetical protein Ct9H300mP28_19280 [Pseudomonadota bacterium]